MIYKDILAVIGNTPMVRLNKLVKGIDAEVVAKIETYNPGNSIKDRMAVKMIEDAEADGRLKPGGTIIEGTSGNTGMGLAIAAIIKGYKCIFTTTDKQSKEKVDALKAFGAEVIVCPTNVDPEDPRSYYSVSARLSKETPNSWYPNQYDNPSNAVAHYEQTGPEIWDDCDGKIDHFVVGVGTGGTISGIAKYLKEKNPEVKIWGVDTYGSIFKEYKENGSYDKQDIYPYITEGIGEDFIPENVNFNLIDHFEKVTDKEAAVWTRRIVREEGIFVGNSAGAAMAGLWQLRENFKKGERVVVLFHDHGSRYLGKMFNDNWMRERGFLDDQITLKEVLELKGERKTISIATTSALKKALSIMKENDISQMPIVDEGKIVGSITESKLLNYLLENPKDGELDVSEIMEKPFPFFPPETTCQEIKQHLAKSNSAVTTKDIIGLEHLITKYDIIQALA